MKYSLILLLLILNFNFLWAQPLPEIIGKTIDEKSVQIPQDLMGKYSLLCFASSMKAESDLESWLDPVYQKFIAKTGIMDDMYDVNIFFIPVLTGTNLAFSASMKKKFREYAQDDIRPHVLFCEGNGSKILNDLEMSKSEVPYLLLVNKEGKILYRTSGAFSEEKFDAIDELIEN